MGEFGRTVGPLTAAAGRDHLAQQFAFFAGGGGLTVGPLNEAAGNHGDDHRQEASRPGNAWVLPRQNAARSAELCMASAPNVRSRWSLTATRPR